MLATKFTRIQYNTSIKNERNKRENCISIIESIYLEPVILLDTAYTDYYYYYYYFCSLSFISHTINVSIGTSFQCSLAVTFRCLLSIHSYKISRARWGRGAYTGLSICVFVLWFYNCLESCNPSHFFFLFNRYKIIRSESHAKNSTRDRPKNILTAHETRKMSHNTHQYQIL